MRQDISDILQGWDFDPEANVRRILGEDGQPKVQVRVDQGAFQGILQVNLDGRPDGKKPHGMDFALDYFRSLAAASRLGPERPRFHLDRQACQELFDESARVYGRYVFLLQLQDYDRVIRDTERNMELFRFVNTYAAHEEDRANLERWWPYILRIHAVARAMKAAAQHDVEGALRVVEEARQRIDALADVPAEEFHVERERSQQALDELAEELRSRLPLSRRQILEQRLALAIERDEFEKAAVLRDEIRRLDDAPGQSPPGEP
ncbi:MAG: hypothetical protein AB1505_26845 [Candidatus Latescibacterota bacterium]